MNARQGKAKATENFRTVLVVLARMNYEVLRFCADGQTDTECPDDNVYLYE
jgi:hypothetical protein